MIAYHLRISFKPGEADAETANRIGYDLAIKFTKGRHAFVCCTHTDKAHVHTHVIINSTNLNCNKKFRNVKGSTFIVRKIADFLCLENGLSIIANPAQSKGKNYSKWQGDSRPPSQREQLQQMIDSVLPDCKNYGDFISAMRRLGCDIKQGKHLAIKLPDAKKFIRTKSLGEEYTEEAIREIILGKRAHSPKLKSTPQLQATQSKTQKIISLSTSTVVPKLLIDIQAKLLQAHSPGFEHFARIYNLKEMAKTLIYMREKNLCTYDLLVEKITNLSANFNERRDRIKTIEPRLKVISELQRQIGTYNKTKNTFNEWQRLKKIPLTTFQKLTKAEHPADVFYEANYTNIALCQAAKKYFDENGFNNKTKKLPTIKTLQTEYATLNAEKKKLYSGYSKMRDEMVELQMMRQNINRFLGEPSQQEKNRNHELTI